MDVISDVITDVITMGEMMVMLVATETGPLRSIETFRKHVAGSEANVAIGLARLGHHPGAATVGGR